MEKYTLTDEHRAQLKPWADKWIANALSTKPMDDADRAAMCAALRGQYEASGIPWHGRVVFVASPLSARFVSGFAAAIWYRRRREATNEATYAATDEATHEATYAATRAATDAATDAATRAAINEVTYAATYAATRAATGEATNEATDEATHEATYAATNEATNEATYEATRRWYVNASDWWTEAQRLGVGEFGIKCAQSAWKMLNGGNQWSAWVAYLSAFRHICKLPLGYTKWDHYEKAALHGGPRYIHAEFCIVSDRPRVLKLDAQNRPHCLDGPYCEWSDGFALFCVHGVRVPAWIILNPETITVQHIEAEANTEIRRVMIDKFGAQRYMTEAGCIKLHEDKYGVLYSRPLPGGESLTMVRVINSSAEADGTFKEYYLHVAPDLKPLPDGNWSLAKQAEFTNRAAPQELTARNAVASTFGLRGEEYEPLVES